MNGRSHLPAGQGMPQPHDGYRRQRPYNNQHPSQHPQHYGQNPIYTGHMNPYANFHPQYQHNPYMQYQHYNFPPAQYTPYQQHYAPSPPQQYQPYGVPPPIVSSQPRAHQSPVIASSPYAQPQVAEASSSSLSQSSHTLAAASIEALSVQSPRTSHAETPTAPLAEPLDTDNTEAMSSFHPPLPWLSHPETQWPSRPPRSRRRKRLLVDQDVAVVVPQQTITQHLAPTETSQPSAQLARIDTPSTTQPPSEDAPSTTPTTPISLQETTPKAASAQPHRGARAVPAVPIIPVLPKQTPRPTSSTVNVEPYPSQSDVKTMPAEPGNNTLGPAGETQEVTVESPAPPPKPFSWANLAKVPTPSVSSSNMDVSEKSGGFARNNSESLIGALQSFDAQIRTGKLAYLKPRGLINRGNMCYMNSVLQVLVFCIPFYDFLDQVSRQASHSFKSSTPLIDAMIMFMREYPAITSAENVEKLKRQLRPEDSGDYGEQFAPDFVYDVVNTLPRFASMRRGQQQDAEEFLGFLLEGLHDECVKVMKNSDSTVVTPVNIPSSPVSEAASGDGWLEVGPKQRAATTQTSGSILLDSPITKIFGGTLRSELKVQNQKMSVTMEPFQPLQLDIGSPDVNNIVDALKALTTPERLTGDFKSMNGVPGTATKQVLIEKLPNVLILHLKRFQYDNYGGTQKIWKKVGYPLELELPKEVFSRQKQGSMVNHGGLPKYRLIGVVYHHGKNASGGHYTVDVRRQNGNEWIRLDDTVINRIGSDDVAEGGSEEKPEVIAAAKKAHKSDNLSTGNIFEQIKEQEGNESDGQNEWKQVNGLSNGTSKRWSAVANGTGKSKSRDLNLKDNKVAYLLFYQKI